MTPTRAVSLPAALLVATTALALGTASAPSYAAVDPATRVAEPAMVNTERPTVVGEPRAGQVLRARPGRWTPTREETTYRWMRDGEPIRAAREPRYRLTALDVGHRISVRVRARAAGHRWTGVDSVRTARVDHRTPVRRRVTYSVTTRGRVTADLGLFRRLAQETFDDPRGWRAGGVQFHRVPRGGHFTLVLAEARTLPSFSSSCSVQWSCRVGRFVVINQTRWQHASPAWNSAGRSLRDYRHLVVNHETGHWLGRGHVGCAGRGPAPVMMQQSKGTGGCRFNPWPLRWELPR